MKTAEQLLKYIPVVQERLEINRYNLGEECVKQPSFYAEVASELPALHKASKAAKALCDYTKADLELQIRNDPSAFGFPDGKKPTNDAVSAAVIVRDEYQATYQAYLEAEELAKRYEAIVNAVEDRKSMIRDLVTLYEKEYYQQNAMEPVNVQGKAADDQAENLEKFRSQRRNRRREQKEKEEKND